MAKIVAIANQKGGVGKTTTSVNLSGALALSQKTVLLVDLDPQANATSGVGVERPCTTVYDCLMNRVSPSKAILSTGFSHLSILPSGADLVGAEVELANIQGREMALKDSLESIVENYEVIILDCPPALGLLTINAFVAAHSVLVPVQCEYYAMEGLGRLMTSVERVRDTLNPELELEGILLTMWDSRLTLARQVSEEVRKYFKDSVYQAMIPRNISLAEAPSYGQIGLVYNATSAGAQAYIELAKEFLNNGEKSPR